MNRLFALIATVVTTIAVTVCSGGTSAWASTSHWAAHSSMRTSQWAAAVTAERN